VSNCLMVRMRLRFARERELRSKERRDYHCDSDVRANPLEVSRAELDLRT
jgi:hypothetical protein